MDEKKSLILIMIILELYVRLNTYEGKGRTQMKEKGSKY